jgi:hypothetical protein
MGAVGALALVLGLDIAGTQMEHVYGAVAADGHHPARVGVAAGTGHGAAAIVTVNLDIHLGMQLAKTHLVHAAQTSCVVAAVAPGNPRLLFSPDAAVGRGPGRVTQAVR